MIGIIGLGRAGLSRLRAVNTLGLPLAAVASRRVDIARSRLDVAQLKEANVETTCYEDWRALIADPRVTLTLICSETQRHTEQARAALSAGHHVAVEFPLALRAAEARSLFALADQERRLLHVETIGTLTAKHRATSAWLKAQRLPPLLWESHFSGSVYRWVADAISDNQIALLAFGRVYKALDLFGPLRLLKARVEVLSEEATGGPAYLLELALVSEAGVKVKITERRAPELRRSIQNILSDHSGAIVTPTLDQSAQALDSNTQALGSNTQAQSASPPLFELDLRHVLAQISEMTSGAPIAGLRRPWDDQTQRHPKYAERELLLRAHDLCDQIAHELARTEAHM